MLEDAVSCREALEAVIWRVSEASCAGSIGIVIVYVSSSRT